jgi:hypothetical protein
MEAAALDPSYIISSSEPVPTSNESGDNPPHAKAKKRYEEIVSDRFLCTQEHPTQDEPEPIVFALTEEGLTLIGADEARSQVAPNLAESVAASRGRSEPPSERVGFGRTL